MATIAVNTRMLLHNRLDGIGWYSFETLKRITQQHPEHHFIFYFDRKYHPEFVFASNVEPVVLHPPARHPWLWYLWFEQSLPYALKKSKPDLFFSPEGFVSTQAKLPQVAVIHDLNFEHFPEYLPLQVANYYRKWMRKSADACMRLATVSQFSKKDIAISYNFPENKIDVVYNGINELYKPVKDAIKKEIQRRFTSGHPYLLYVGSLHKRKNIANMLKAFDLFKKENACDLKFLLVSDKNKLDAESKNVLAQSAFTADVIFCGRQPENVLVEITAAAALMLYVSLFEGFGIPVVEAMKCEVPVITSSTTCLPEIGGNASLNVNPKESTEIASAIKNIMHDQMLRNRMIENGRAQAAKFTWDKTAALTWQTIEMVLDEI
jgi:glycosyltransferase involved in cell wall biosynthesis